MANEFIIRKGYKSLSDSQITGSLSVSNAVTASFFTGSFRGDGSELTGIDGFPFTGSASISGSLTVVGPVTATEFIGNGSQLTGIDGFPFTGSAAISGSLTVDGNVIADSFTGSIQGTATTASYVNIANVDGFTAYSSSVNTAIGSVLDATTPITATINNTNSPFTITNQTIVIVDSTNGNVTVNLPDLDTVVGTPNQRPIIIYKNDYSQNVIFVSPSGSQLINGSDQDIIVSIQLAVIYNPTSAGWVTEGTSAQSLAELELFFVPKTETGSLSVATASYVEYTDVANKPTLVSGSSQISFTGIINKPTLVSGSSQVTYSGLTGIPSGIVSSSVQVKEYNVFATTGSNQFNGNQSITGSLTVSGQVVAQTLNVQQVTSSIVYSSGSNVFGNSLSNTQQFTGSVGVTGSLTVAGTTTANGISSIGREQAFTWQRTTGTASDVYSLNADSGGAYLYNNTTSNMLMQWLEGGNVSIGGYTPLSVLDVIVGASGARRILFNYDDSTISIKGASNTSAPENLRLIGDSIIFNTGTTGSGTEKLRLNSSGNLGLGVTPSAWNSSFRAIQVGVGASFWASNISTLPYAYMSSNQLYDASNTSKYIINGFASWYIQEEGTHKWLTAPSGTAGNAISFTQAMTLDASGRLGIGTTSPSTRLTINNGGAGSSTNYQFKNISITSGFIGGYTSSAIHSLIAGYDSTTYYGTDIGYYYDTVGYGLTFSTNPSLNSNPPTERMRITSGGEVNIGGFGTIFPVLTVKGIASSPHIGSTWSVSANQDGTGRTIIGTAGQGRSMYFENNGDIVIPNNTLEVGGSVRANGFKSYSGTSSIASGATSTIHTMSANGLYTVQVIVNAGSLIYSAAAIFIAHNSNAQYVKTIDLYDGPNVTLDNSGSAIRITNGGFSTFTWNWSILFQPF